jgi:tetratricopeptide (TPR) repeat protein
MNGNHKHFGAFRNNEVAFQVRVFVGLLILLCGTFLVPDSLRSVLAQSPDDPSGVAELKRGDYENAVKLLSARLAKDPADLEAQTNLLRAYLEIGRYADAEAAAKKFLLKQPDAADVGKASAGRSVRGYRTLRLRQSRSLNAPARTPRNLRQANSGAICAAPKCLNSPDRRIARAQYSSRWLLSIKRSNRKALPS